MRGQTCIQVQCFQVPIAAQGLLEKPHAILWLILWHLVDFSERLADSSATASELLCVLSGCLLRLLQNAGSGSGGYLTNIICEASCRQHCDIGSIPGRPGATSDFERFKQGGYAEAHGHESHS